MKIVSILLIPVSLSFCSCASQTFYTVAKNEKGAAVSRKTFQNYGDLNGNVEIVSSANGTRFVVTQPTGDIPIMRVAILNKKGDTVLGYNEIPMMAGVNNSKVNDSLFNGISKGIRSVGSVIGTVLAGMAGIETAKAAGTAATEIVPKATP